MRKLRSSTKILIGSVLVVGIGYLGWHFGTSWMIERTKFDAVVPSKVNIVGIDPGAGYRIIVANQIAQLVETSGGFGGQETGDAGATSGSIKKRIPIREMLGSLRGDPKSVGAFVAIMNNIREDDTWPADQDRIYWKAEDIAKAVKGDPTLSAKLVRDLNMKLDGTPLPELRFSALENGIMLDIPVKLSVNIQGKLTSVVGRMVMPYKPRLMLEVEKSYKEKAGLTRQDQANYYELAAKRVIEDPKLKEDIAKSLTDTTSERHIKELAEAPEQVLKSAFVVVNENYIHNASYNKYDGPDGKPLFNLSVSLNDEGRRRLWQFSKHRVGDQLLLVADGVAIAAPRIQHELATSELAISQMPDEILVQQAVDMINKHKGNTVAK